jgi:hypothetical protein
MLHLAATVKVEINNEYRVIPRIHPARAMWMELMNVMMSLGAKTRVLVDYISERNRGLKATKDLKPGEDIIILPVSSIIKF